MAAPSHSTQGNVSQIIWKGVDLTTQNAIPIPQTENPSSKEAQHKQWYTFYLAERIFWIKSIVFQVHEILF